MEKLEGITAEEVLDFAVEVRRQMKEMDFADSEDYVDALDMVGDLLKFVSHETLTRIYSDEELTYDKETVDWLNKIRPGKLEKAQEALDGLVTFGIRRTTIDDI